MSIMDDIKASQAKALGYNPEPQTINVASGTAYASRTIHRLEPTHGYQMQVQIIVEVSGVVTATAVNPIDSTVYATAKHSGSADGQAVLSYMVKEGTDLHSVRVDLAPSAALGYRMIVTHHKVTEGER